MIIFDVEQDATSHARNTKEIAVYFDEDDGTSKVYGHSLSEMSKFVKPFFNAGIEPLIRTSYPPFITLGLVETRRMLDVHGIKNG